MEIMKFEIERTSSCSGEQVCVWDHFGRKTFEVVEVETEEGALPTSRTKLLRRKFEVWRKSIDEIVVLLLQEEGGRDRGEETQIEDALQGSRALPRLLPRPRL